MTLFDPTGIIRQRAAGHRAELSRIEAVLTQVAEDGPAADLDSPVRDRFALLIGAAREKLDSAERDGPTTTGRWLRLDEARQTVEQLGREVLAYVEGRLLAENGLDGRAVAAAERLVASLTWRTGIERPAVLGVGDAERIDHLASIVRFRPLGTTAWQLPVIAHEFGHHVATRLGDAQQAGVRPVNAWLAREADAEATETGMDFQYARSWTDELFADVFATYALGTAYPLTVLAMRVRFDQLGAESATHPPWPLRVATMIATLDSMGDLVVERTAADTYRGKSQWLAKLWAGLASQQTEPDPRVQARAAGMVRLLAEHAQPRLRYDVTWPVARLQEELDAPGPPPPPVATPAHVLNAAWAWRVEHPEADDTRVSTRALALCALAER